MQINAAAPPAPITLINELLINARVFFPVTWRSRVKNWAVDETSAQSSCPPLTPINNY